MSSMNCGRVSRLPLLWRCDAVTRASFDAQLLVSPPRALASFFGAESTDCTLGSVPLVTHGTTPLLSIGLIFLEEYSICCLERLDLSKKNRQFFFCKMCVSVSRPIEIVTSYEFR